MTTGTAQWIEEEVRVDYCPHPRQREFHESDKRFRFMVAGIQGGKTLAGTHEAARMISKWQRGFIIGPDYPQLRDSTMAVFFENFPSELIAPGGWSKQSKILTLKNGATITFKSATEPDSLRGPTLGWFWLDEAALMSRETWEIMCGRILARKGDAIVTTTPKSYEGHEWLEEEYNRWLEGELPESDFFLFDNKENPYLDRGELKRLWNQYEAFDPDWALQEMGGKFVRASRGRVYKEFRRETHLHPYEFNPSLPLYRAWDFGWRNPTVVLWIQVDAFDNVYIFDELDRTETRMQDIAPVVRDRWTGSRTIVDYCDPAGAAKDPVSGTSCVGDLANHGIACQYVASGVVEGLRLVHQALHVDEELGRPRLFVHPRCRNTIKSFENYHFPKGHDDRCPTEVPKKDGVYEHWMDSVRYFFVNHFPGLKPLSHVDRSKLVVADKFEALTAEL